MARRAPMLLCALLALAACSGPAAPREGEVAELRARLERLEREDAESRERLAADVAELRASLDEANRRLALMAGEDPDLVPRPGQPRKSPRAALRESLGEVMDMSRRALDRLSQGLERSLQRKKPEPPAQPEK